MDEAQFKKLALWQQRVTTIACDFERYFEAMALFGEDDNFMVCPDGSVGFIDHSQSQTFDEAARAGCSGAITPVLGRRCSGGVL